MPNINMLSRHLVVVFTTGAVLASPPIANGLNTKRMRRGRSSVQDNLTYMADVARPTVQYIGDQVNTAVETATPGVHYVSQRLSSAADTAAKTAQDGIESVKRKVSSAAENAQPTVDFIGDQVNTAAENAQGAASFLSTKISEVAESAKPTVTKVGQQISTVAECAGDALCSAVEGAKSLLQKSISSARSPTSNNSPTEVEMDDFYDILSEDGFGSEDSDDVGDYFWEFVEDEGSDHSNTDLDHQEQELEKQELDKHASSLVI